MATIKAIVPVWVESQLMDECPGHHWLADPPHTGEPYEVSLDDYNRLVRAFNEFYWAQEFLDALLDGPKEG